MKLTLIEITNLKRLKAVRLEPSDKGLTVIGGRNGQGKTSVLDGIAYALGGEKFRPTSLKRDGAIAETKIHIETDDGIVIERKGKNASLSVYDSTGTKRGQQLIDTLISKLAIDLPKFLNSSDKDKADILLQILGIGDKLDQFDRDIKAKFDTRTSVGREADRKQKAADDMPYHEDVPEEPVSVKKLIEQQQEILARNGIKEEHRRELEANKSERVRLVKEYDRLVSEVERLKEQIKHIEKKIDDASSEDFTLESTTALEEQIAKHEETNRKIAENKAKTERENEAADLHDQYDALTEEIEKLRADRLALLRDADLPFPGLSVNDEGCLTLNGKAWDCMSGSQQMIVGTAIASRLNPSCRFVLLDKLEQLDLETLEDFDKWLVENDLQALATRVSTNSDGECSLVIEDGEVKEDGERVETIPLAKKPAPKKPAAEKDSLGDEDYD